MAYETLRIEKNGAIFTVLMNRPERRNPLDKLAAEELLCALKEAETDKDVRVFVLTGEGKAFCAGGDIKIFSESDPLDHLDAVAPILDFIKKMFASRLPTIARVQGHALGGGAGLASLCDFAVAADDIEMGYPEINMAIIPAAVAVVLARMVPRRIAVDLLFRGKRISAGEAVQYGLLNEAVPRSKLDQTVADLAEELGSKSPVGIRQLKSLFYGQADMSLERAIEFGLDKFVGATSSEDAKEGLSAFLEKRKPQWKGK